MKFFRFAALFALASLPLLLVRKERALMQPQEVDSDHIFDEELSVR
jgi:hypothetical protein